MQEIVIGLWIAWGLLSGGWNVVLLFQIRKKRRLEWFLGALSPVWSGLLLCLVCTFMGAHSAVDVVYPILSVTCIFGALFLRRPWTLSWVLSYLLLAAFNLLTSWFWMALGCGAFRGEMT